jgi:hypothetical protein
MCPERRKGGKKQRYIPGMRLEYLEKKKQKQKKKQKKRRSHVDTFEAGVFEMKQEKKTT